MNAPTAPTAAALLRMRGIEKSFPGVRALRNVDLELQSGEVLALLGENGAGKSTLIKILGGAQTPDSGTIQIDGEDVRVSSPVDAQRAGIAIIYQEFNLVPSLSAVENIFLGQERTRAGFIRRSAEKKAARELFERMGVQVDPDTRCGRLAVAQQQVVEIAKALSLDARIIVMDEPSATLTPQEVDKLFAIIRELRSQGIGIIYISHRLDEIFAIADRVTVLRDGAHVKTGRVADVTRKALIERMVGRALDDEFPSREPDVGEVRLEVKNLTRGRAVRDVSFNVRRGEVLGITGLVGAGRTETARLIFGADKADKGEVWLDGQRLQISAPRQAIRNGICLLSEDRKADGLVLVQSVRENFSLPSLPILSRFGFVKGREERTALAGFVKSLSIKIPHAEQRAQNLSGGNQQKVVLAKWLHRNCEILLFDEPTRGIDVGAKYEIYLLIHELTARGKSVVMISSELPEILGMSDRILVMHEGRIRGEITDVRHATQEAILQLAVG